MPQVLLWETLVSTAIIPVALGRRGAPCVLQQKHFAWSPRKGHSHHLQSPWGALAFTPSCQASVPALLINSPLPASSPHPAHTLACSHLLGPSFVQSPGPGRRGQGGSSLWGSPRWQPHHTPHTWGTLEASLGHAMEQHKSLSVQAGAGASLYPGEQRGHKWAPATMLIPEHETAAHPRLTPKALSMIQVAAPAWLNPLLCITPTGHPTMGLLLLFLSLFSY